VSVGELCKGFALPQPARDHGHVGEGRGGNTHGVKPPQAAASIGNVLELGVVSSTKFELNRCKNSMTMSG